MKKFFLLVILAALGAWWWSTHNTLVPSPATLAGAFETRLTRLAGDEPNREQLLAAYPGLLESDFRGVLTLNQDGYARLLENVSRRLGIELQGLTSLDALVAILSLDN